MPIGAPSAESDEELYDRVRAGDGAAFDRLYARYERSLYGFVFAVMENRADAEDIFHEAFMNTLKKDGLRFEVGGFRAYLYGAAKNLALKRLRASKRGARLLAELPETERATSVDRVIELRELEGALEHAVTRLSRPLSAVYHLRMAGLSYEEMSRLLELPLGTIKSRMSQLVERLQRELAPWIAP